MGHPWWRRFQGINASVRVRPCTFAFFYSLVVKAMAPYTGVADLNRLISIVRRSCFGFKLVYMLGPLHRIALVCSTLCLDYLCTLQLQCAYSYHFYYIMYCTVLYCTVLYCYAWCAWWYREGARPLYVGTVANIANKIIKDFCLQSTSWGGLGAAPGWLTLHSLGFKSTNVCTSTT